MSLWGQLCRLGRLSAASSVSAGPLASQGDVGHDDQLRACRHTLFQNGIHARSLDEGGSAEQVRWRMRKPFLKRVPYGHYKLPREHNRPLRHGWLRLQRHIQEADEERRLQLRLSPQEDSAAALELAPCADAAPLQLDPERDMWAPERPKCLLCRHGVKVDHRNVRLLSQFISSFTGRMYDRHITGLCEYQNWRVYQSIKLARRAYLMPTHHRDPRFLQDPPLFDPMRPMLKNAH